MRATGRFARACALTLSWRTVYSDRVNVVEDVARDERIGYDICGDSQNMNTRTPVCPRTLAFVFFHGAVVTRRTLECSRV